MRKNITVLVVGLIAGLVDLIPLVLVQAPMFNMLTVLAFWFVTTFFIHRTRLMENGILNGLVVASILMVPTAMAVSATNPTDFFPMMFMALILGPLVGFALDKFA